MNKLLITIAALLLSTAATAQVRECARGTNNGTACTANTDCTGGGVCMRVITFRIMLEGEVNLKKACDHLLIQTGKRSWSLAQCMRFMARPFAAAAKRADRINADATLAGTDNAEIVTSLPLDSSLIDRACGDNVLDTLYKETCDDGNTVEGDGCSPDCQIE